MCDFVLIGGSVLFGDIVVAMTPRSLNGSQRVVLDGVITDDECRELHRLSNVRLYSNAREIITFTHDL